MTTTKIHHAATIVFDGTSTDFRRERSAAVERLALSVRETVAVRHDVPAATVAVTLGGTKNHRVATVTWPGGQWRGNGAAIDDFAALVSAKMHA